MDTVMTVEFDCGYVWSSPVALRADQTMLANIPLVGTMEMLADEAHEQSGHCATLDA